MLPARVTDFTFTRGALNSVVTKVSQLRLKLGLTATEEDAWRSLRSPPAGPQSGALHQAPAAPAAATLPAANEPAND